MDPATLAAFRASGETDINKFLANQATADVPPGVPAGSYAGSANFQGATNAERGVAAAAPTGQAFADRLRNGLSALSGIPAALQGVGQRLGLVATPAPTGVGNLFAASRQAALESDLNALQARSTQLARPSVAYGAAPAAAVVATATKKPLVVNTGTQ